MSSLITLDLNCAAMSEEKTSRRRTLAIRSAHRCSNFARLQRKRFDFPRIAVSPDDDFRARMLNEVHDSTSGGRLGREKSYLCAVLRLFLVPHVQMRGE